MGREVICIKPFARLMEFEMLTGTKPPQVDEIYHPYEVVNPGGIAQAFLLREYPPITLYDGVLLLCFECDHFAEVPEDLQRQIDEARRAPIPLPNRTVLEPYPGPVYSEHGIKHEIDCLNYFIKPSKPLFFIPPDCGWPYL